VLTSTPVATTPDRSIAQAIAHDELRLFYQPIVRAADGAVVAVEALVRWQHPTLGLLTPDRFLPMAERDGQLPLLDGWVLHRACQDLVDLGAAAPEHVNVNLSTPSPTPRST
jgi:EAL domain-containing protein (putative c-di-GMP-specific phosphodiesterase class I)